MISMKPKPMTIPRCSSWKSSKGGQNIFSAAVSPHPSFPTLHFTTLHYIPLRDSGDSG